MSLESCTFDTALSHWPTRSPARKSQGLGVHGNGIPKGGALPILHLHDDGAFGTFPVEVADPGQSLPREYTAFRNIIWARKKRDPRKNEWNQGRSGGRGLICDQQGFAGSAKTPKPITGYEKHAFAP